ncbi:MAG: hypothetical protein ACI9BW_000755 [Gammaproteobacteria bacterium]|jgi:hypothetical protein
MHIAAEESLPVEIQTIRELTEAMLAAAANHNWQEVQRIDVARFQVLRTVPAALFASNNFTIREVLTHAMSATQDIGQQAKGERDIAAGKLKQINQRQQAAKAYATAS